MATITLPPMAVKITQTNSEPQAALGIGSSTYYTATEFRKLAQKDLQHLLKKYGRV